MTLEEIVVEKLLAKGYTVTTAESCTGGLIAATLINVSGVSEIYREGYITYANESKEKLLGVKGETLRNYGAVSELGCCLRGRITVRREIFHGDRESIRRQAVTAALKLLIATLSEEPDSQVQEGSI